MTERKLPHLIIFNPDQWRGDVLGHLGNPAAVTPRLDQLVKSDAVSFRNAFCQNPVCTPSRCSFMTGWYPHVRGHRTMYHMLRSDEPILLRSLKESGYYVWWGGKNDLVPGQDGYDAYCDWKNPLPTGSDRPIWKDLHTKQDWRGQPDSDTFYSFFFGKISKPAGFPESENFVYNSDWHHVLGAVNLIKQYGSADSPAGSKPLCIYLPLGSPHPPYAVEEPWFSLIDRSLLPRRVPSPEGWQGKPSILRGIHTRQRLQSWDEDRWAELRATYYGMCARGDHQLGLIVDALRDAGIYDDCAIFFFADHGDFTGDYGLVEKTQNTFEDFLVHVPLIVKPPKTFSVKPGICDALVELVDFPATVEEFTGLAPSHTHFGRSLLPLIKGEKQVHRQAVFSEGGRLHGEFQAMEDGPTLRDPNFLYWPRLSWQQAEGPEHTKAVMCRTQKYKYVRRLYEQDELYDLELDPHELINRIADPEYAAIRMQMIETMLTFMVETADTVPHDYDQRS